jgi:hypothetical protein
MVRVQVHNLSVFKMEVGGGRILNKSGFPSIMYMSLGNKISSALDALAGLQ